MKTNQASSVEALRRSSTDLNLGFDFGCKNVFVFGKLKKCLFLFVLIKFITCRRSMQTYLCELAAGVGKLGKVR